MIDITINGQKIEVEAGKSILSAALAAGIYIPHLCSHPELDSIVDLTSVKLAYQGGVPQAGEEGVPFKGCNLCLVEIEGRDGPVQSCKTVAAAGMTVSTDSEDLKKARGESIARIFERHPHACVLCAQSKGCDRNVCSLQIPVAERCCSKFGVCEIQKVGNYLGLERGLPPYIPLVTIQPPDNEPLIKRDYNLCIGCLRCVRVCKEVKGADALCFTVENGLVKVGSKAPTLKESGCQFCGYCVEVCPTGALMDKDVRSGKREEQLVPCRSKCPAEIDVPRYIGAVRQGKYDEAVAVIRERIPFPAILGRVCFHPCEAVCRRGSLDEPVSICGLKRAAADLSDQSYPQLPPKEKTGRRVAVVGSGPAGLTAAYYLNSLGHAVTVFETLPKAGGMLRVGIPAFRLPREVLDREIKAIEDAGVEIKIGSHVASIDSLLAGGFQAVFVTVGAHQGTKMGIPGQDAEGVIDGVDFLKKVSLNGQEKIGPRVAVIGGGNVALDSARSALRLGGQEVTVFYRRTREEMPAHEEEIKAALEEGVKIEYQVAPKAIEKTAAGLNVEFLRMEQGAVDESGRCRPVAKQGCEFTLPFDAVLAAVGQKPVVPGGIASIPTANNRLPMELDPTRGIFIGGDFLTGPKSVIDAVASGRQGAQAIDKFLGGEGKIGQVFAERQSSGPLAGIRSLYADHGRTPLPVLPAAERVINFPEVSCGFDAPAAELEALRCLRCGLRFRIKPAAMPPERYLILDEENIRDVPGAEGVYVLYDEEKEIYKIMGVENLRQALAEECAAGGKARYFFYEADPMFTMKERQLVQQYMKKGCGMPPGNCELDDLF